jgi:hypothetical protein
LYQEQLREYYEKYGTTMTASTSTTSPLPIRTIALVTTSTQSTAAFYFKPLESNEVEENVNYKSGEEDNQELSYHNLNTNKGSNGVYASMQQFDREQGRPSLLVFARQFVISFG